MAAQNIDVIVTPQNTGHSMDFQANTRYLTHCGGGGDADIAAVFPLNGASHGDRDIGQSALDHDAGLDLRCPRGAARVRQGDRRTLERIGLSSAAASASPAWAKSKARARRKARSCTALGKAFATPFPTPELVDATPILVEVRYIKSAEEIEVLTKSMEIVEEGYKAEIEAARPGARDWDVWAAAQYGMMRNGSEMPVHCNWISGKNPVRTLTRPSMRVLEHGDLIINELEANWVGYRAQGVQPVFVGAADPVHQELIKVQREIFDRVMER